ncbi:hypothetical protein [Lentzea pudingi]|uniref:hypothetical protein n=1 Tax=Lentzea pudingi TaxID=1789439 RepID=UPI00166D5E5B|nr:hypothetical protein [Lentzea pudingi]
MTTIRPDFLTFAPCSFQPLTAIAAVVDDLAVRRRDPALLNPFVVAVSAALKIIIDDP